jgi:hypothetical protein
MTGRVLASGEGAGSGRRLRLGWLAAAIVVVLAAGAVAAWLSGVLGSGDSPGNGPGIGSPAATAAVVRADIAATTPVTAMLGYAGSYTVTGEGGGTLTWLPPAGRVIRQGEALYRVDNGSPVVLLYGRVPAWRALGEGVTGADVSQLNHDLVASGYADRSAIGAAGMDFFSVETALAVQRLEEHLGVPYAPGILSLGQVVFEPQPIRVTRVNGRLGAPATGPVLTATSDRHVVKIALDTSQEGEIQAGDAVTVTLPDGSTTPGLVFSVGSVATTASGQGQGPATTIPVLVRLTHRRAAGHLDQVPVTVNITTATARDVLMVPVTALQAQSSDGYAVEVVGPEGARRWVRVTPGIFDDANGLVQVTGALRPGQRVVVASS